MGGSGQLDLNFELVTEKMNVPPKIFLCHSGFPKILKTVFSVEYVSLIKIQSYRNVVLALYVYYCSTVTLLLTCIVNMSFAL